LAAQAAITLFALELPGALAQTPAAIMRGEEAAGRACLGCHAVGTPRTFQGIDVPSLRAIANVPGQSRQRLEAFIMTPHRPMPGMSLDLAEVSDIVSYILSLK
jgi:mono/diheme cytochrome c family protein